MARYGFTVLLALLHLCWLPDATAQAIYRIVDSQGRVTYSDRPQPGAEAVEIGSMNTVRTVAPPGAGAEDRGQRATPPDLNRYQSLRIVRPTADEAVRSNAGNLSVAVAVNPELMRSHRFRLLLDGQPVDESVSGSFQLNNVNRGTHSLTVQVLDRGDRVLIQSLPVTFHLLRHSVLNRAGGG
jgi:hypothetical protein